MKHSWARVNEAYTVFGTSGSRRRGGDSAAGARRGQRLWMIHRHTAVALAFSVAAQVRPLHVKKMTDDGGSNENSVGHLAIHQKARRDLI